MLPTHLNNKDIFFNASVAELRRKAQEHSEALLKNIQSQQQKIADITIKSIDTTEKASDDFNPSIIDDGILNNKVGVPPSSLDVAEITNTIKTDSATVISPIDLPKFPPHNYLSALSNFGFPGLPILPDINAHSPGLPPRFASNLANLIDKTSNDTHLKSISKNITGINSTVADKTMSPTSAAADIIQVTASASKIKCSSPTSASS